MLMGVTKREKIDGVREGEITRKEALCHSTNSADHMSGTVLDTLHRTLHDPNKVATLMSFHSGVSSGERVVFDKSNTGLDVGTFVGLG